MISLTKRSIDTNELIENNKIVPINHPVYRDYFISGQNIGSW
ncbi:hypothetical protein M070_4343 [Bacteroides fragilis str. A7 (UDC12-2)]|nr:hypothetical protein M074_4262 [Bacteroides fragilis str. DS-166]EXZ47236.1 hypothetical protein M109_4070 [Bacteroides fragilis str. 3397 N2]EXZ51983.1 hypothetical protein M108_4105 [Bacteroides fragilis str. 3397 T14]EYA59577.1 hypothetical protein M070_4343 [Bacteroides fragilis str. A7 (UDC12-2)]